MKGYLGFCRCLRSSDARSVRRFLTSTRACASSGLAARYWQADSLGFGEQYFEERFLERCLPPKIAQCMSLEVMALKLNSVGAD